MSHEGKIFLQGRSGMSGKFPRQVDRLGERYPVSEGIRCAGGAVVLPGDHREDMSKWDGKSTSTLEE